LARRRGADARPAAAWVGYAQRVAYRADRADVCEAPTAEGVLHAEVGPRHVKLAVGRRSLDVAGAFATVVEHRRKRAARDRRASFRIDGRLVVARGAPREGMGVWVELDTGGAGAGFRRIFGVEPDSLLEAHGLAALAALDQLAQRVCAALAHLAGDMRRAFEIGAAAAGGLDKVLVIDGGDRYDVFARRLFRDRAHLALIIHADGRIAVPDRAGEITVRSRHGVTVLGDYIRFADPDGADLLRVAIPWLTPEDRDELARRIGALVDRDERSR
jgi:hypothetical protein